MTSTNRALPGPAASLALIALSLGACGAAAGGDTRVSVVTQATSPAAPNVVVILTDDQRPDDVRVMSAVKSELAAKGVTFAHNFATYPLCCPSRTTFMTGQYAHNHHILTNNSPRGGYAGFVRKVDPSRTIGVKMQAGGYRTGYVGKYLNGFEPNPPSAVPPGWDVFNGLYGSSEYEMFGYQLDQNGTRVDHGTAPRDYQTDVLGRKAVDFVRQSAGRKRPFFLTFAPVAPHQDTGPPGAPNPRPAPRDVGRFARSPLPKPPSFNARVTGEPKLLQHNPVHDPLLGRLPSLYRDRLASLLSVDDAVRHIVATLRRTGELKNTMIIFTSDNGFSLGEHREVGKEIPYDVGAAVPLIIRGPGFPAGVTRPQLVGNIDLSPTILDLAGLPWRAQTDGVPLRRVAADPSVRANRPILFERPHIEGRPWIVARTRRYAYIRYSAPTAARAHRAVRPATRPGRAPQRRPRPRLRRGRRRPESRRRPSPPLRRRPLPGRGAADSGAVTKLQASRAARMRRSAAALLGAATVTAVCLPVALGGCGGGTPSGDTAPVVRHPAPSGAPNVVVVLTDDQRVGDVRVMSVVKRELAAKGVTFAHNFATYPLCCPSRVTFMTGKYAHNHGVETNDPPRGGYPGFVRKVAPSSTIGVRMQAAGYRTGYAGKFLNRFRPEPPGSVPPGWDVFNGLDGDTQYKMYGYSIDRRGRSVSYGSRPRDYQTDVLAGKAADFVRQSAGRKRPFFLTLAPIAPHENTVPPGSPNPLPAPRDIGRFASAPMPNSPSFNRPTIGAPQGLGGRSLGRSGIAALRTLYRDRLATLQAVDDAVGRLVGVLRDTGELANTVIIYTSDNGFLLGEHGQKGKQLPYEEAAGVPLIIRGPGFPAGATRTQPTGNIDLAPTILDLAGQPWRRGTDGISLLGAAASSTADQNRPILLERSRIVGRAYAAIRTRRYVFVRSATSRGSPFALFDLQVDPYELHNVALHPAYAAVVKAMRPLLARLRHCSGASCRVSVPRLPKPS